MDKAVVHKTRGVGWTGRAIVECAQEEQDLLRGLRAMESPAPKSRHWQLGQLRLRLAIRAIIQRGFK